MKVFEVSDVAFKDMSKERKSRNERHFAAAWYGKSSGFEVVHGLLDRIMGMLRTAFRTKEEGLIDESVESYWIEEVDGKSQHIRVGQIITKIPHRSNLLRRPFCVHIRESQWQSPQCWCLWYPASFCSETLRVAVSPEIAPFPIPTAN